MALNKDTIKNALKATIASNKAYISRQSLPSHQSISVNTSVRQYVAPSDGYFYLRTKNTGSGSSVYCVVSDTGRTDNRRGDGNTHEMLVPCIKDDILSFDCSNGYFERLTFYPTVGSEK